MTKRTLNRREWHTHLAYVARQLGLSVRWLRQQYLSSR
jgi:hypothetical protein